MFRLHHLRISKHKYFNDLILNFTNPDDSSIVLDHVNPESHKLKGPYTTLIIGPNGTGKSQILNAIVEIFNYLNFAKNSVRNKSIFDFKFIIKYNIDDVEFTVDTINEKLKVFISGVESDISNIELPSKLIASAINLNDRFPIIRESSKYFSEQYVYLGIRTAANSAYISNHVKKIIDSLSDAALSIKTLNTIKVLFNRLELRPNFSISFKAGRRFVLKTGPTNILKVIESEESFHKYYIDFISVLRARRPDERRLSKYERILTNSSAIQEAIRFLKEKSHLFEVNYLYKIKLNYEIDFDNLQSLDAFVKDAEVLKTLRELEMISVDNINLHKKASLFKFEQASSGEYHLLTSLLGIIGNLYDNSLVVIDEPEISLHPNWQIQYMDILNEIFEKYENCHFIIASHSHFLVSDLKGSQSAILSLKINKETGNIDPNLMDLNTYSWSAEQVLLEIFGVPTTRNYYISDLVGEILKLMADPNSSNVAIREKIQNLKDLNLDNLSDVDPLKEIIEKLLTKIE